MSEDPRRLAWDNPDAGHRGKAPALRTMQQLGRPCRELKIYNEAEKGVRAVLPPVLRAVRQRLESGYSVKFYKRDRLTRGMDS